MSQNPNLPRRTIQELLAIHKHESTIREIILEGTSDKDVIERFLEESTSTQLAVYEIGLIEIGTEQVLSRNLPDNNRGRVITLAYELESARRNLKSVALVADSDFDLILGIEHSCSLLLMTDYTCMEMYAFNEKVVRRYLQVRLHGFPTTARRLLKDMGEVLRRLFAIRLAHFLLKLNLKKVDWTKSCSLTKKGFSFQQGDYISRYLNKNKKAKDKKRFVRQIIACESQVRGDPRASIHGHDFICMLIWYVSHHPGFRSFARTPEAVVQGELFSCLEIDHLAKEPLFQRLLKRING
jgi:hypothetical protein